MSDELPLYKRSKTRTNRTTEETILGPSAGKTLVKIVAMLIAAMLLMAGVIKWADVAGAFTRPLPIELKEGLPSAQVGRGHPSGRGREPRSRTYRMVQGSLPGDRLGQVGDLLAQAAAGLGRHEDTGTLLTREPA